MAKVMIVDDDPNIGLLVEMTLRKKGDFQITNCSSGEMALETISHDRPDIVLLDIMMPGMDGYEVCKAIKSSPDTKFISVIILSARREMGDKIKGMDLGADDYIVKPFDPDELLSRVKARLRIQQLERELLDKNQLQTVLSMSVTLQHEINNPLAGIMGNSELLKDWKGLPPTEVDESIAAITQQAKRIRDIVQKLSSVTKVVDTTYVGNTRMIDVERSMPGEEGKR
ncbi:MAG: response regulator [Nitrospinae bacterium]|nr:response regulator [Nitrospinota bacterium]